MGRRFAQISADRDFLPCLSIPADLRFICVQNPLFFLQKKSHGLLPMALRMTEGTDRDQGIPKARGGPGFLPSLPPSLIKVPIRCAPPKGKCMFHFTRPKFSVNKILLPRVIPSVTGDPDKFCCGLGVRAVRAGSIGRDGQRLGERDEYPPEEAGGLGPRPLHGEITAL